MSAEAAALHEGDWLDVVDGDGIWNVAQVLKLPTADTVEVTYDCWGDEYNEELPRDSPRIAPFRTHTWAVKCWAKLNTWPWWPALVTVRAPGSDLGSCNLRLEERLLVDFLDSVEFPERCRCWVKKSKIVAFQSDEETRKRLTKLKKNKMKTKGGQTRAKNMELSTGLLARCDAREDFPEFVEGTLPVQFEHHFTRPTEQVRKEIGEEIWMRGFSDNRKNHAATHAYTPGGSNSDDGETSKSVEKNQAGKATPQDESPTDEEKGLSADAGLVTKDKPGIPKEPKNSKNNAIEAEKKQTATQKPKTPRKRVRPSADDETSDSTDTSSRAGKAKSRRGQNQENELQADKPVADETIVVENGADNVVSSSTGAEDLRVSPRKHGKTPKTLKTPRRSAANLPPYTPPYARVLLKVNPRNEKRTTSTSQTSRVHHANPQPRSPKVDLRAGIAGKEATSTSQQMQKTHETMKRHASSDSSSDDGTASPMKSLARLTKATLRADQKLQAMETALDGKLAELVEKLTHADKLQRKCAALSARVISPPTNGARKASQENSRRGDRRVLSPTADSTDTRKNREEDSQRGKTIHGRPDASHVPTLARRSSQAKCDIRGLELALDDRISQLEGLGAATTDEELDAIKADLLKSPEVQAAISRIQHPSYGWGTPPEPAFRDTSSLSSATSFRAPERSRFPNYLSAEKALEWKSSPRSPNQQFGRSWGYERDSEASVGRSLGLSSFLQDSPSADHSSFGFSINDNFSINQWYRDLYPKPFAFQRP